MEDLGKSWTMMFITERILMLIIHSKRERVNGFVPIGSLTRIGSVSLLGFPVPARFSARTLNLYFFLVGRPLTLQRKRHHINRLKTKDSKCKTPFRQQSR